ncbi:hypothetical protein ROP_70790 [Rhodococcus opacus B4]|uniref:NHL repeat-containing protein n=1 Tax=Rhodococcus opacus (strain B4) TaxID=632772 RepID=C1B4Y7_RHOOB|nr:hypothetical protein ROP_70790 [Rhodococcus opacus B4]
MRTRRNLTSLAIGDTPLRWTRVPTGHDGGTGWLHSGIAALPDGSLLVAHPEGRDLIRISETGDSTRITTPLTEMHCLTVATTADDGMVVWAADNGHRFVHDTPDYDEIHARGRVVALDLDGRVVRELDAPAAFGPWSPTSVALVDTDDPGSDVWVADGYGQSLIHRYSADRVLLTTLDGTESGTRFDCPHGILIRTEGAEKVLYVADRSNRRIVVFGLDGTYLRTLATDVVDSPSSMVDYRGHLVVTELFGALAIFDGDDYLGHIGSSLRDHDGPGWPNRIDDTGQTVAPELAEGIFNSPHGITVRDTTLYLTEWMIGGRVVRLDPVAAH